MSRSIRLLSPVAFLPGLVFEGVVRIRNRLYDAGLISSAVLPRPVISIGNLTLGGAGKTPLVIHTARILSSLGVTPALLSRGYGRSSGEPLVLPPEAASPAGLVGDEPALIRRRVPGLWLGISADRRATGLEIAKQAERPVFLLDDAFQHRKLARDLDILIVDRTQPLAANRVVPRGTLREPAAGLRRADVVVINGAGGLERPDPVEAFIRRIRPDATVLHCRQEIERLVPFPLWRDSGGHDGGESITAASAFLVAAVGNPERFRTDVVSMGIEVAGARFFGDHRRITRREWESCAGEARRGNGVMITTEKDAVKIERAPDFPLLVAVQSTRVSGPDSFQEILQRAIEERR